MKKIFVFFVFVVFLSGCAPHKENPAAIGTDKLDNNWWKERHERVLSQLKKDPKLILIGNSITHMLDDSTCIPIWEKYLNQYRAVNMGFSGDRTENVIWRLQNGEIDGIHPKLANLMIGTNNVDGNNYTEITQPKELAEGIWKICQIILEKLPETEILLIGILPYGKQPNYRNNLITETNKIISKFPEKEPKIHYRDLGYLFLNGKGGVKRELMPDVLHPNAEGQMLIFDALSNELKELINDYNNCL